MSMEERMNMSAQFGTAVTTGQGQGGWQNKKGSKPSYNRRIGIASGQSAVPPLPTKFFSSGSETNVSQQVQSADGELTRCTGFERIRDGSDSMESMQQHVATAEPVISDADLLSLLDSEDSEEEDELKDGLQAEHFAHPSNIRLTLAKGLKEKKKVGRPIAYRGDPEAPELTDLERRRIKRRIANRESARRVRHKRQELVDDLQVKIDQLQAQNANMRAAMADSKQEKEELSRQLREANAKQKDLVSTNANMQLELESLRSSLQLRMTELEKALDRQENGIMTDGSEDKSFFGSEQAQSGVVPGFRPQPLMPFNQQGDFKGSYSFQLALDNLPSFQLGERLGDFMRSDTQELSLLGTCDTNQPKPPGL